MTLSGISAAESGTALNRVLESFIKPSEAMTAHLKTQGYESGVAAVQALGLKGTMDMLRETTGGNVETLAKLFNETRAAKGALALMANEGQNYLGVFNAVTSETERLGATQRAFNEQSKSFSFQLELAKNNLVALGIEIGQRVLPALSSLASMVSGVLTTFSDLPGPVKAAVAVFGALVGVAGLVGGSFLLLAPRISHARDLMADLAVKSPALAGGLRTVGGALGALGLVLTAGTVLMALMGQAKAQLKRDTEALVEALEAEEDGMEGAADAALTKLIMDRQLIDGAKSLGVSLELVSDAARGDKDAMAELERQLSTTDVQVRNLGSGFGQLGTASDQTRNVNRAFLGSVGEVSTALEAARKQVDAKKEALGILNPTVDDTQAKMKQVEQILGPVGDALGSNAEEVKKLDDIQKAYNDSMKAFADGASVYKKVLDEKQEAERTARDTLDRTTADGKKAWEDFKVSTDITLGEYNAGLQNQITSAEEWSRNYVAIYQRFGPQVATILASMGREGQIIAAKMTADLEGEGKKTAELLPKLYGQAGVDATTGLFRGLGPSPANTATQGQAVRDEANRVLGPLPADALALAQTTTGNILAGLAPMIPNTTNQAAQTSAGAHLHFDPLPAWAAGIAQGMTGNMSAGLGPMIPNTTNQAQQTRSGAAGALDPLMADIQRIAGTTTSNMLGGLDPMAPGTRQRADETSRGVYDPLGPVPGWTGGTGGAATDRWLGQLDRGLGATFNRAAGWANDLLRVLNPLLKGAGAPQFGSPGGGDWPQSDGGVLEFYASGGVENHVAQIAPGRWPARVWAEPETEGEAYIPLAASKRRRSEEILSAVARRFGLSVVDFKGGALGDLPVITRAWGGLDDYGLPHPPDYAAQGTMVGRTAREDSYYTFRKILEFEKARREAAAAAGGVGGGSLGGGGWQAITNYLSSRGVPYTITSTTGGKHAPGSYHYQGKAVDMVSGNMMQIFNTLAGVGGSLAELFHDPAGWSIKNGQRVNWTVGGHGGHVHGAVFDQGGILQPGYTLAYNGTGMPERVISFANGGEMGQWYGGPGYGFIGPQGELPGPWFAKGTTIPQLAQSPLREIVNSLFTVAHAVGSIAAVTPARQAGPAGSVGGGGVIDNSVTISAPVTVEVNAPVGADVDHLNRIVGTQVNWALKQWGQNLQQLLRAQGRVRIRV